MKKRFKYLALREAKNTGAFGHYLTMPVTDKTRTLIIGERLGYLRETAGLSQQDVCEIIGVAKTTYSGYELGQHEPTCETICRLAELYQIETDFIIGKGFVDPYSDDITEHYFQCKGFNDLGMENITKTMNAIASEADKVEKSE